jgi:hypothetical protein
MPRIASNDCHVRLRGALPAAAGACLLLAGPVRADHCTGDHEIIVPDEVAQLSVAIAIANDGDCITLKPGTYSQFPGFGWSDKALTIRSFSGDPTDTILDGAGLDRVFSINGAGASGTRLEGLTIRNGFVSLSQSPVDGGAGLRLVDCDVTILNCIFENNDAINTGGDARGGGIYAGNSALVVIDTVFRENDVADAGDDGGAIFIIGTTQNELSGCTFESNFAANAGGAVRVDQATAQITDCEFKSNAGNDGGALFARLGAIVTIDACRFTDNSSVDRGGAVSILDAATIVRVRNSTFQNNSADGPGGAIARSSAGTYDLRNCTFVGNVAASGAVVSGAGTVMYNCIVWGNQPVAGQLGAAAPVEYCLVENGQAGAGNVDLDPQFADVANGDLRLLATSPAIDAGSTSRYVGPLVDLDGGARGVDDPDVEPDSGESVYGPVIDLGAFEWQQAPPVDPCPFDSNDDGVIDITDMLDLLSGWGLCP